MAHPVVPSVEPLSPSLDVSTKFMETYQLRRPVSGTADLTTFLNRGGHVDVYAVGNDGTVHRIRQAETLDSGWVDQDLGVAGSQLVIFPDGTNLDDPLVYALDAQGRLTRSAFDAKAGKYVQAVVQPPKATRKIERLRAAQNFGSTYFNVVLEGGVVATNFLQRDGTWAAPDWAPKQQDGQDVVVKRIAMSANSPVQTALFAIGADQTVLFAEDSLRYTPFVPLATKQMAEVAVVNDADGLFNVFAIDLAKQLWWKKQKPRWDPNRPVEWEPWVPLAGDGALSALRASLDARGVLEVFALGSDATGRDMLFHTRQIKAGRSVTWSRLFPLGNPVSNAIFTVGRDAGGYSTCFTVSHDDRLFRFWQNPATTQWTYAEVVTAHDAPMVSIPTHSVQIAVQNENGYPAPDVKLAIRSNGVAGIKVNGLSYLVSEFYVVEARSDSAGNVLIDVPTTTLAAPALSITTEFMASDEAVVVEPNRGLQERLHATSTDDVWNAKTKDGRDVLAGEYRTQENAAQLAAIMRQSMSLGYPPPTRAAAQRYLHRCSRTTGLRYHRGPGDRFRLDPASVPEQHWMVDFSAGAPRMRTLSHSEATALMSRRRETTLAAAGFLDIDWGDVWNGIREGVSSIVEGIKDFIVHTVIDPLTGLVEKIKVQFHLLIDGIVQLYETTISYFQQAFDIVEGIWNKVKVFFEELYEWLAFLFAWKDIVRTADVVEHSLNTMLDYTQEAIGAVREHVVSGFDQLDALIKKTADEYIRKLDPSLSFGADLEQNETPIPAVQDGSGHNVVLNTFMQNQGAGATVVSPAFALGGDPFGPILEKLTQLESNFEFGEGKAAFDQAAEYFLQIGKQPDRIMDLLLAGMLRIMEGIALFGTAAARGVLLSVLDIVSDLIAAVKALLNEEWEIPVVSQLYELITGGSLSFRPLRLVALICAVPATLIYKIVEGRAPYPDAASVEEFKRFFTADWLARESGIKPARAALGAAANGALQVVRKVFAFASAATYIIRIWIETGVALFSIEGTPPPRPLAVAQIVLRFLTAGFGTPWVVKDDAGGFEGCNANTLQNLSWLLGVVFGPVLSAIFVGAKAPPDVSNGRFVVLGTLRLGLVIAAAVVGNVPAVATTLQIFDIVVAQAGRFLLLTPLVAASEGGTVVAMIVVMTVGYLVTACLRVANAEPSNAVTSDAPFALALAP